MSLIIDKTVSMHQYYHYISFTFHCDSMGGNSKIHSKGFHYS